MASCEAQLLKQKVISKPFTAKQIAEGALWDHLTQEDSDYDGGLPPSSIGFSISNGALFLFRTAGGDQPGHLPQGGPGHPCQMRKRVHCMSCWGALGLPPT